jgi:dTDP-D-glucose 4,6-dehydratase
MLDTTRAQEAFGFKSEVGFEDGLARTVEWFRANREWVETDVARRAAAEASVSNR